MRRVATVLMVLLLVLVTATVATACPTCKDSLAANDPHHQNMVAGYYYSILFMMSMPYLLLGTFGTCMYLSVRRARARAAADAAMNAPVGSSA